VVTEGGAPRFAGPTRPGGSPPTSPSSRRWCVGPEHRVTTRHSEISITLTAAGRWQGPQRRAESLLHCYLSPPRIEPRFHFPSGKGDLSRRAQCTRRDRRPGCTGFAKRSTSSELATEPDSKLSDHAVTPSTTSVTVKESPELQQQLQNVVSDLAALQRLVEEVAREQISRDMMTLQAAEQNLSKNIIAHSARGRPCRATEKHCKACAFGSPKADC
jgi:hypothetical protein